MDLIETTARDGWSDVESNFFVERYNLLKHEVGKGKTFNTRKAFFQWISDEMRRNLQSFKTEQQITSRFYTLNRRNQKKNNVSPVVNTSVDLNHGSSSTVEIDSATVVETPKISDSNKATIGGKVEIVGVDINDTLFYCMEDNLEALEEQNPDIVFNGNDRSTDSVMETVDAIGKESQSVSGLNSMETEVDNNDRAIDSGVEMVNCNGSSDGLDSIKIDLTKPNGIVSRSYEPTTARMARTLHNTLGTSGGSSKFSPTNIGIATIYNAARPAITASFPAPSFGIEMPSSSRATATSNILLSSLPTLIHPSSSTSQVNNVAKVKNSKATFTVTETKYLLDQYYAYMDEIGPMKLFRTKNSMWETLASKMNTIFDSTRTAEDLSKRVTEVISVKKAAVNENRMSGASRQEVEYEEEIDKITSLDDSIEPEVMRGVKSAKYKKENRENREKEQQPQKKPKWDKPNKKAILGTLSNTMLSMEKRKTERETAKEERRKESHKALLEMIQSLKKPEN